jgi:Pro-kumamolisin, activation domain/S-layer homology domain
VKVQFQKWVWIGLLCITPLLSIVGFAQQVRITRHIDSNEKEVLARGIHPQALAGSDQGNVPEKFVLQGMVLEFGRSPEQQVALNQLLPSQQDRLSPDYHRWLTPEQFCDRFGVAQADINAVRQWLEKEGFNVEEIARSRTFIRFSGTASQVKGSFGAEIHLFSVRGKKHFAPASSISIPTALGPLVREVRNLDNFHPQAPRPVAKPAFVNGLNAPALAPGDLATIYDFQSLHAAGYDGTGQAVVVVGQTDISLADLAVYRSSFGLPAARVTIVTAGADPGVSADDVIESDLDLDVVSAAAPNASILFVNAASVLDSVQYAIDNNLAPVITMSYGLCEPLISAFPATSASVLQSWAQQANAQGISWIASSGDSGAAGCDPSGYAAPLATQGLAVNLPASIPEVTGVGGTAFEVYAGYDWGVSNGPNGGSAVSYVPERAWNESGTVSGGSGGGSSIDFPKPIWQSGLGVPNDGARDVPDVAFAASMADGCIIAENGHLSVDSGGTVVGGTSAAAPLFAGILVLLNQYLAPFQLAQPGLGNVNPTLYSLAQTTNDVFHDIAQGDNMWRCAQFSPDCGGPYLELGFLAGPGYDRVTGLGSIDAYNLLHEWPVSPSQLPIVNTGSATVTFPSGNTATLNGEVNPNHLDTHAYFLYGVNADLSGANQTPIVDLGSGASPVSTSTIVSGLLVGGRYYFQLIASNASGTTSGAIQRFSTTAPQLPGVTTLSAFGVSRNGAVLSGQVTPNGSDTHYRFVYGTNSSLSSYVQTYDVDAGSGSGISPATTSLTGLAPDTLYYFQLQASNGVGSASGAILSFTINSQGQPPGVATGQASSVTASSATLQGSVGPNGLDTHYWFIYSAGDVYPNSGQTGVADAGSGSQTVSATARLAGLVSNTLYTFQIVASNSAGVSAGYTASFTTGPSGQLPQPVTTGAASNITSSSANLSGTVNPNGKNTQYWFLYSESPILRFATRTSTLNAGSGTVGVAVNAQLTGLSPGTYYYQLQASGGGGAFNGSILSFVVPGPPVAVTLYSSGLPNGGAGLSGQLNPNDGDTQYWFAYGTSPNLSGAAKTAITGVGQLPYNTQVDAMILSGLTPGTMYYFQLQASNSLGTSGGKILSFVENLPIAVTSPATYSIGAWTMKGSLTPNGLDTQWWFLYGTSPTLSGAFQTYSQDGGSGGINPLGLALPGLMNNTTYYYQLVASNAAATVRGSILSFTTANGPTQPSVTLDPVTQFTGTTATLTGTINPNSVDTTYAFYCSLGSTLYNAILVGSGDVGSGTTPVPVSAVATGLTPGMTFYYQLQAVNTKSANTDSQILNFIQPSGCSFSFPAGSAIFVPADALPYALSVNATQNTCGWSASTDQPGWLTLNNPTLSGSGQLNYTVALNDTGADRVAHITVGGQQFAVTQRFTSTEFNDTPASNSFFDSENLMFQQGVTVGCAAGSTAQTRSYCPDALVTRDQMAAFIVRAVTGTTPTLYPSTPYFADVPPTNPFFPYIQKLMELGITSGCAAGPPAMYCPSDTIPRWQMAIFMVRARLELHGAGFTTATVPYFADAPSTVDGGAPFPFIQRSYEEHVTVGCGTNPLIYCPDELVTRGQMAAFVMRALFNETTILSPTDPQLAGVSSTNMSAAPGSQITVTITGVNTNFHSGDTLTVPSGMLDVSSISVNSPTSITAMLTTNGTTIAAPQSLVVTSGGQNLTLPLSIHVGTY